MGTILIRGNNIIFKYMIRILLIIFLLHTLAICCPLGKSLELIEGINSPDQIQWISDNEVLMVKNQDIYIYNIYSKSFIKLGERKPNSLVGLGLNNRLLFCEFEHFIIHSPEEFSTIFRIKDSEGNLKKELKIFETIRPIFINEEEIFAMTAVDFLEEHYYKINIETEEKIEIENPIEESTLDIPKYIDLRRAFLRNKDMCIIEDMMGNILLYSTIIKTERIMPIFTAVFKPVPIKNPTKDANPNFILLLKSFLANIYSNSVAPKNAPINTPGIFPIIPPSIEPTIEPTDP